MSNKRKWWRQIVIPLWTVQKWSIRFTGKSNFWFGFHFQWLKTHMLCIWVIIFFLADSVETTSDHFGESKARFRNTEGTHLFTADERAPSYWFVEAAANLFPRVMWDMNHSSYGTILVNWYIMCFFFLLTDAWVCWQQRFLSSVYQRHSLLPMRLTLCFYSLVTPLKPPQINMLNA